jgi:hypothetical protein
MVESFGIGWVNWRYGVGSPGLVLDMFSALYLPLYLPWQEQSRELRWSLGVLHTLSVYIY